jgi:hypothetical protein
MSSSDEEMEMEGAELPRHDYKSKQKTSAQETIEFSDEDEENEEEGEDNEYENEALDPNLESTHRPRGSRSRLLSGSQKDEEDSREGSITVLVSGPARPWEYRSFDGDTTVDSVLDVIEDDDGDPQYRIEYESGRIDHVSKRDPLLYSKYARTFVTILSFSFCFMGKYFCKKMQTARKRWAGTNHLSLYGCKRSTRSK